MKHVRDKLLIFTLGFPYGGIEAFFENELPYLSSKFREIEIVPMFGAETCRNVPENVTVHTPFWSNFYEKLIFFIGFIFSFKLWCFVFYAIKEDVIFNKRYHIAVFWRILNWGVYRVALEQHPAIIRALHNADKYIAYSYWGHTPALGIPSLATAGIPCAVRFHNVDLYAHAMNDGSYIHRNAKFFPWRREIVESCYACLFVSDHGRTYFIQQFPELSERCYVSRLGVRDRGISPDRTASGNLVIASCSYIMPRKRVDRIAAFACALADYYNVDWHHFGSGDMSAVQEQLVQAPTGLTSTFHGWVDNVEVAEFYRSNSIDLFVNFSTNEGVPVSIMEAISFDIPAIATDVDGTSEVCISGASGLLIGVDEPDHPSALASYVVGALKPGGTISKSEPRKFWREMYDADHNYRDMLNLFETLETLQ